MSDEHHERLQTELSLLEAMYPGQIAYDDNAREVKYNGGSGGFTLRLPEGYPGHLLPEVLAASVGKADLREQLRQQVNALETGEEVLDSAIAAFSSLAETQTTLPPNSESRAAKSETTNKATVIVWLHHLLNTNKRKQALSPPSPGVSGITKPGYPGVLIYSGPASAVHEHVNDLKAMNWQAFQVRLESGEDWTFNHGTGVKEVESMKDVVNDLEPARKEEFMEAMRMK